MSSIYIKIPPDGGGGGGAVDSVNGKTGAVTITKTDVGLGNVDNTSDINKPISTAAQTELDLKQNIIPAFAGAILYNPDAVTGNVIGIPNWQINEFDGLTQTPQLVTDNGSAKIINNTTAFVKNNVASPNESYLLHFNRVNIDVDNQGHSLGTNGRAIAFTTNDFFHDTEAYIGEITFTSNAFNIGLNGAGPVNANGFSYSYGFGQVRDNVTILNGMQGYGFQPSFDAGAQVADTSFLNAFYDATNASSTNFSFYTSVNLSPQLGGILNNRNMQSININPSVGEFFGNANYIGAGIFGTFGNFGASGFFQGINVSPTIASAPNITMIGSFPTISGGTNITGLDINMSNVTGTNVRAARFTGDVDIQGDLNFTGALSIGKLDAFGVQDFEDSPFQPTSIHTLITQMIAPNGVTTTNADMLGVNTAALMNFFEDSVTTSGAFGLGACALALPAVIAMETTATVQHVRGAAYAISLDGSSTGGTIQNAVGCRAVLIPNGITTVEKYIAYEADLPFGTPNADDSWGFHCNANIYNYMAGSLVIGSSQEKTTNLSIGLEIASNTKAFMNARMTTTERDALTAVNGMQIYNSTDDKLQVYAGGSWVDLH